MRCRKLGNGRASIRFPYVFGRDGAPSTAMFAVSFARAHAPARIKQGLYDVLSIREWRGDGIEFAMFAAQNRGDADPPDSDARNGLEMPRDRRVDAVCMDGIREALGRIRRLAA